VLPPPPVTPGDKSEAEEYARDDPKAVEPTPAPAGAGLGFRLKGLGVGFKV